MRKLFRKSLGVLKKFFVALKYIGKVYRDGGYTTINVASINYGAILKKKNILITGGSSGIGLAIAKKCICEGANVLITGRSLEKLETARLEINSSQLQIQVWDISDIHSIEDNLEKSKSILGGDVDVLVNNAGVINAIDFPNVTEEMWNKVYETNSKGLFFVTQSICRNWMQNKTNHLKKVINISSQGGFVGATYPYRMTKWDIAGFTQGLGLKLASKGIIVNGIAPGIIATSMQPDFIKQKENVFCSLNPVGRIALPEEIAELALFLISDGSNFIIGQTIVCDGGFTLK